MTRSAISCHAADHVQAAQNGPFSAAMSGLALQAGSRRWFLRAGLGGYGALSAATLLNTASALNTASGGTAAQPRTSADKKAVILFWLSGGPSHIDMWDPKPEAPAEIRGPYQSIATKVPGVQLCEHFPLQAAIADKISFLRAVDCQSSNHTPITMQAGNPLARRTDNGQDGDGYPSMGSVVARYRGANHPDMPAFVGLAPSWKADVWEAGNMGNVYAPVKGLELTDKFRLPEGVRVDRLQDRDRLRQSFDRLRHDLDRSETLAQTERYNRQAYEMVVSGQIEKAFDLSKEPDALRAQYGRNSIGEKAILARRLVESGATFVLVSGAWGYFDHHGDSVQWGGIVKGLTPLLPQVDQTIHALITDLESRGLLDQTLVIMMGEFGRGPVINKDAGRDHWTNVMSMIMAGGGLRHGQAVGGTDSRGYGIQSGAVRPQDLAATVFRHAGVDLNSHWISPSGRPTPVVVEGGRPIPELI